MSRSTVFRKTKPVQKSFTLTHQDVDSDSEYHDVRLSSNDRRIPRFGGQNDGNYSGNEDIENYVEQPGLGTEEDETELLTELRQLSRNLTTARPTKQKLTDRYVNTVEDLSPPKKTVKEFNEYYHKSVNKFLQKKKEDLEKIKKLKEETEAQELRHKPTLIAKQQQNMRHIPIAERAELVKAKKERDILRMKKEQEERLEKEFRELTFAPRTNHSSVSPVPTRKREIGSNFKKNDEGRERNEGKRLMKKAVNKNNENCRKQGSDEIPKNTSNNPGSQTKTVDEKKRKSPMQEQTLNARLATEPCNQTVQERFNSQEPNKSNRGLSTERSKSPLEAKTKKKKDMRESNFLVNREQEVKNRQMEEEKLMKRYHQMLDDDLKRVTDASMHKKDIKRSSVSSNSVSNNISRKSPVESYENNDQEVKRENNRSPSPSIVKEKEVTSNKINQENKLENKKDNVRPEDEVVEIESIKQNLLSIQDNLQTLKQSFRSFQTAQPIPKAYLSFIDSPKEIKTGMDDRKQSLEKKMFLENEQSRRSTSPLPNSKTSQDTSLELHNVTKKPIRYQYTGTLNICKDQLIDNDTESFGNGEMSFSAAYDLKLEEKNLRTQSKPSMSMNVDIKKEDSIFSWKEISENELRQSEGLDRNTVIEKPGNNSGHTIQNLLSRKQADHSESLKDISQMALKKFKRVDRQQAI